MKVKWSDDLQSYVLQYFIKLCTTLCATLSLYNNKHNLTISMYLIECYELTVAEFQIQLLHCCDTTFIVLVDM